MIKQLKLKKVLAIIILFVGGVTQAQLGTEIKIDNKHTFINTINNIRNARKVAVNNKETHMLLRYNRGFGAYTYFQMRVKDFYIIGHGQAIGKNTPNIIPYPEHEIRYPAVLPTVHGLGGIKNALLNPAPANSAHIVALVFAESVRSDAMRNYVGRSYSSASIMYAPLRPIVTNWNQISLFFKIDVFNNNFRPLKDVDYIQYYKSTGKPHDLGEALKFLGDLNSKRTSISKKVKEESFFKVFNASGENIIKTIEPNTSVKIYSITGQKIYDKQIIGNSREVLPLSIKPGAYIFNVTSKGKVESKQVVLP
ncbi:hypothetical protein T190115A13A_80043 [Tenacibaculum sp. 190524A02b]|uniref:Por secretion system C-terminal sorting domain-containing protein n=1 Tax=Tenacibaculum vairaonense TaxID=3137860 RepID=A0ABP1FIR8_9FLAO